MTSSSSGSTPRPLAGIHHVTAIGSDPAVNRAFYTETLGLRMVKKTVNFDDPSAYHLYYGDGAGHPGTILTFFPWPGARRGSRGTGQATVTSFLVPEGSLGFWAERLAAEGVVHESPSTRFDEEVLTFLDPDGLKLELVAHPEAAADPRIEPWTANGVAAEHAIRGFWGVTLTEASEEATRPVLETAMGLQVVAEAEGRTRFEASSGGPAVGRRIDVLWTGREDRGRIAAGTVHHVALRVEDDADQLAWRERLVGHGLMVTEVKDRCYFHSIYYREPGGVLFELATDPPGFTVDETPEELGSALRLPPWYEEHRAEIERALPPLEG